MYKDIGMMI